MSDLEYVQAIPLFTGADSEAFKYFNEHKNEIDALTGSELLIALPDTVKQGDSNDVYSAVGSKRYPGLKLTDLPCLWVEPAGSEPFGVSIPTQQSEIVKMMRHLTQSVKDSKTAKEFRIRVQQNYLLVGEMSYYLKILAVCIVVAFIASTAYYFGLPVIRQYDAKVLTFGVYVALGLLAAFLCFGILRSTGKVSGSQLGSTFELGGAAALFVVVVGGGIWFEMQQPPGEFGFTIYFHEVGDPNSPAKANGKFTLFLDEPKVVSVADGFADVQRIPVRYSGRSVGYRLDAKGYSLKKGEPASITLPPSVIPLKIPVVADIP